MACSDEHARMTSRNGVPWAVDGVGALFMAWRTFSGVCAVVWVPDKPWFVVWGAVAAAVVTIVGGGVAVVTGGSGCKMKGWEACCGGVGWSGNWCWHLRGAGGCFGAGDGVVVVAVNNVDSADGNCASIVSDDVAHSGGDGDLAGISSWAVVCVTESAVEVEVVWELESTVQLSIVWVLVSVVTLAVGSVCISASIPTFWNRVPRSSHLYGLCFVSQLSRSAILPLSSPSFTPFRYPAWNCASLPPCRSSM
jgi:hypothetical protein